MTAEHLETILYRFCSTDPNRISIDHPFTRSDGYVYATCGRTMVRVKADRWNECPFAEGSVNAAVVWPVANWRQWPALEIPGNVDLKRVPAPKRCPKCHGDGLWTCAHCDSEVDCEECGGTGKVEEDHLVATRLNGGFRLFSYSLLHRVLSLPGAALRGDPDSPDAVAAFTFDGGEGLLMPWTAFTLNERQVAIDRYWPEEPSKPFDNSKP